MKVSKIIGTILLTIAILICSSNFFMAFAVDQVWVGDAYRPQVDSVDLFNVISASLRGIGICAIVVGIALIGFGMILGSASEKAVSKEKFIGIIVAGVLLTSGTIIADFIKSCL